MRRQDRRRFPAALVDQGLQPRAISARLRAEDAIARAARGVRARHARGFEAGAVAPERCRERVHVLVLVERGDGACGAVDEVDQVREGVAEEARDAQGDIDARAAEDATRHDLEPGDAAGLALPVRARAHQRQRLRDVVAAGAHVGGAPGRQRDARADNRRAPARGARPAAWPISSRAATPPASAPRGCRARRNCGPVGSTSGRPRVGAPDGPGGTKRPSRPRSRPAISASPLARTDGPKRVLDPSRAPRACASTRHRSFASPRTNAAPAARAAPPCRRRCARRYRP